MCYPYHIVSRSDYGYRSGAARMYQSNDGKIPMNGFQLVGLVHRLVQIGLMPGLVQADEISVGDGHIHCYRSYYHYCCHHYYHQQQWF